MVVEFMSLIPSSYGSQTAKCMVRAHVRFEYGTQTAPYPNGEGNQWAPTHTTTGMNSATWKELIL